MDVEGEMPAAAAAAVVNGLGEEEAAPAPFFAEQLDVEAYTAQYSGRTRLARLIFIADVCGVEAMQLDALRMAYDEIKKGEDTQLHRDVALKIKGRLGSRYGLDQAWADTVNRRADQRKEKLDTDLDGYRLEVLRIRADGIKVRGIQLQRAAALKIKGRLDQASDDTVNRRADQRNERLETEFNGSRANLIKESIRMGYNDMGDFFYAHGNLLDAFKSYLRTRDYFTTSKHIVQMCMNVILVSIELGQFAHVSNYVSKAEQTPDLLDPIIVAKLRAAAGVAYMETKKYKLAARKFVETGIELGNNYSEVIAPQDVAVYGALCALASFDYSDLKSKVIDNINFRNFLELVPEVRELVNDFYASHYGSCLGHLEKLKPNLLLDIHLHEHVETLYTDIRHKAITQYTLPFISVDLNTMAAAFKTCVPLLEKELVALITENKIQARIDSHKKILYARHADQRTATFQRVLQTGNELERDVKSMLLRANLLRHGYISRTGQKM